MLARRSLLFTLRLRRRALRRITPSFLFNNFQTAPSQPSIRKPFASSDLQTPFPATPFFSQPSALPGCGNLGSNFKFLISSLSLPVSPLSAALPYVFVLSPLSTAFTHFDRGGRVASTSNLGILRKQRNNNGARHSRRPLHGAKMARPFGRAQGETSSPLLHFPGVAGAEELV